MTVDYKDSKVLFFLGKPVSKESVSQKETQVGEPQEDLVESIMQEVLGEDSGSS